MMDIVIFGVNGNLARNKLIPAIFTLEKENYLPPPLRIWGLDLGYMENKVFRKRIDLDLRKATSSSRRDSLKRFCDRFFYMQWSDPAKDGLRLKELLSDSSIFYLSIPPSGFATLSEHLARAGLARNDKGFRRLVLEKPFGWDEKSSSALDEKIHSYWEESQIYRLDHFLGKETIQNILVFRFANMVMEPLWNRNHIRQVQITAFEEQGIGTRGAFYDEVGALRDMVQNHLLQILALTAMEPPASIDPTFLRDEKVKVLRSIPPLTEESAEKCFIRGQYRGYGKERGILPSSTTETFVAMKLFIDNWRWKGIPFYLRTGKRMKSSITQVAIEFRMPPLSLFNTCLCGSEPFDSDWLIFDIKPEQKMSLIMQAKKPGIELEASSISLSSPYQRDGYRALPDYSSLIKDLIEGDRSHSLRFDEIHWSWHAIQPVLDNWASSVGGPFIYEDGSGGPAEQNLILEEGHEWKWN